MAGLPRLRAPRAHWPSRRGSRTHSQAGHRRRLSRRSHAEARSSGVIKRLIQRETHLQEGPRYGRGRPESLESLVDHLGGAVTRGGQRLWGTGAGVRLKGLCQQPRKGDAESHRSRAQPASENTPPRKAKRRASLTVGTRQVMRAARHASSPSRIGSAITALHAPSRVSRVSDT